MNIKKYLYSFIFFSLYLYTNSHCVFVRKPLHILFVVGHFPSPSQTFILNIMTSLIDRGHTVSVFSVHKDKEAWIHPHIIEYNLLDKTIYEKLPKDLPDYDIVFCQFGYLGKRMSEKPELQKWLQKRKLVVCFRGADLSSRIHNDPFLYKSLFAQADLFLPVCDYFKKRLISLRCPADKIAVHYSAINCDDFFFKPRKKPDDNEIIHLISVSRLVKKKAIDDIIKAMALLVKKHKNIRFTIVGDGPEKQYLQLLIHQLRLEKYITLFGWATQQEVVTLLDKAHIFVLPSRKALDGNEEGIPNALKEAMAMGLITIGTLHAGNPELIDHKVSGFLVPEKDISILAQTIEYVIENPQEWESIQYAARKKIEEDFETKRGAVKLEALFYGLLR